MSDDRDWTRAPRREKPPADRSTELREGLRAVGFGLDPEPDTRRPSSVVTAPAPEPDRAAIRAVLEMRGAPAKSILWLSASCPSLAHAEAYEPPRKPMRKGYPSVQAAVSGDDRNGDKQ